METKSDNSKIKNVIMGVASSPLLIDRAHALNLLYKYNALVESSSLSGSVSQEIERQSESTKVRFYSVQESSVQFGQFTTDFEKVEKNSVAVVPVMGAMMRETYCSLSQGFISGTRDLENTFRELDNNPNIDGIVAYINTPGGEARGNESLSRVIKSLNTPIVGFFEGMASAGVYAFQGVNELYASEKGSYWGSIGTYVTLVDDKEFFERMGVNILDIYATESTEKNKEFRDAINGDDKALIEMLDKMNENFIKDVKDSRPNLVDDGLVFKGKLYNAIEAKKIGAIDGIKSLDFAIQRASFLSRKYKRDKKKTKNQNNSILTKNNDNIMSIEQEKKLSLFERIFGEKTAEQAEKSVDQLESKIGSLETNIKELTKEKTELSQEISELEQVISEGSQVNEQNTQKISDLEKEITEKNENLNALSETEFKSVSELVADYKKVIEHNQKLGGVEASATPIDNQQHTSHEVSEKDLNKTRTYQDIINEMNVESKEEIKEEN